MKVGDLVWALDVSALDGTVLKRRLAIIVVTNYDDYNPYIIQLVACGRQGKTSQKYLEPLG